jgi:hypothetical protein
MQTAIPHTLTLSAFETGSLVQAAPFDRHEPVRWMNGVKSLDSQKA